MSQSWIADTRPVSCRNSTTPHSVHFPPLPPDQEPRGAEERSNASLSSNQAARTRPRDPPTGIICIPKRGRELEKLEGIPPDSWTSCLTALWASHCSAQKLQNFPETGSSFFSLFIHPFIHFKPAPPDTKHRCKNKLKLLPVESEKNHNVGENVKYREKILRTFIFPKN